jgi:predicted  nucleic acid-binding Zn-ribbon protein
MSSTDIEKKSLEAHVELCAERYEQLEHKLTSLDKRVAKIETGIDDIKQAIGRSSLSQSKQLITIGTTLLGVGITAILGLLVHLINK